MIVADHKWNLFMCTYNPNYQIIQQKLGTLLEYKVSLLQFVPHKDKTVTLRNLV